ncbi:hypothetical protein ALC60_05204 [Trachymyrmex zeteki]|uniref:Uncharacterized protein n=1 Tax=Mycetomoellerius zeteki TaxID=64791 RepID=A0A151X6F2_9HYME|nr:hypothetical protein ALC60_05204 [Trachymyrmex zeteki]
MHTYIRESRSQWHRTRIDTKFIEASSRSNGRTRAYLSNGRRNSDESCVMTRYEMREVARAF